MDYVVAQTLPPNTPQTAPVKEVIMVAPGTVRSISVYFPWGCAGLAHVTIFNDERQVWPTNKGGSYRGNDLLIKFPENYPLVDTSNQIMVVGWNDDDTYQHTPIVRITVLADETPGWARLVFGRLIGKG